MSRGTKRDFRVDVLSSVSIMCLASLGSAAAQTASGPQVAASVPTDQGLEEIVISTEKVKTDLQKTSASVSAVDSEKLEKSNVVEPADLTGLVPGLTIAKNEGYNRVVSIRGIGFETPQNDSAQPSVSYHINGVYIVSTVALNADLLDVSQVEVARGPQGTVFGQNSTGGTINVITNQPKLNDFSGSGDVSYGNYNLVRSRGAINVPITDTIAVRAAFQQDRHDGFAVATQVPGYPGGYEEDNTNSITARLLALWKPIDDFSLTLGADYFDDDENARAEKSIDDPDPDPRRLTQDYAGRFGMRSEVLHATADWDLGFGSLKSLTSFQYLKERQVIDNDRSTYALHPFDHDVVPDTHRGIRSITQEVNVSSNPGGIIDWIAGAFFLDTQNHVGFLEYTFQNPITSACIIKSGCSSDYSPSDLPFLGNGFESLATPSRTSVSGYGQGTYHLADDLSLSAGARYTHDELSSNPANYFAPPTLLTGSANRVTGKAAINYNLTPSNLAYVSYTTGFKPGASNLEDSRNPPLYVPFVAKPESIEAYEIGSKNDFFGKKIRLNASAFYYDYTNFQFAAEDPKFFVGGVDNIPKSMVYGLEAEFSALLPYNLRLDINGALERSKITSHFKTLDPVVGNSIIAAYGFQYDAATIAARDAAREDVYGHQLPKLPHSSLTFALLHALDLGENGILTSRVQVTYRAHYAYRVFNNSSRDLIPTSTLTDLDFEYEPASAPWFAEFKITNLFDRTLVNSKYTDSFGIGSTSYEFTAPRQFIGTVGYRF